MEQIHIAAGGFVPAEVLFHAGTAELVEALGVIAVQIDAPLQRAVEIVGVDYSKGIIQEFLCAHNGVVGTPGLCSFRGDVFCGNQFIQSLESVFHPNLTGDTVTDSLTEHVVIFLFDDEYNAVETCTDRIKNGEINNKLSQIYYFI